MRQINLNTFFSYSVYTGLVLIGVRILLSIFLGI